VPFASNRISPPLHRICKRLFAIWCASPYRSVRVMPWLTWHMQHRQGRKPSSWVVSTFFLPLSIITWTLQLSAKTHAGRCSTSRGKILNYSSLRAVELLLPKSDASERITTMFKRGCENWSNVLQRNGKFGTMRMRRNR
jgi:hypothetical protein